MSTVYGWGVQKGLGTFRQGNGMGRAGEDEDIQWQGQEREETER